MLIGELEDVIKRAERYPQIRFIASRWGKKQGAPEDTLTLLVGAWPITERYGKPYLSPDHKAAYNVPYPFVPAESIVNEDGEVRKRGYRWILGQLVRDGYIDMTKEVENLLRGEPR